jgi:ABC-type lipoprotein export system ATPase subunit
MLSGLVSPAKILVLDEPTNALDPELKQEVLALMDAYRVHKNAILIITHDRDLDGLFDQVVRMDE